MSPMHDRDSFGNNSSINTSPKRDFESFCNQERNDEPFYQNYRSIERRPRQDKNISVGASYETYGFPYPHHRDHNNACLDMNNIIDGEYDNRSPFERRRRREDAEDGEVFSSTFERHRRREDAEDGEVFSSTDDEESEAMTGVDDNLSDGW